MARSLSWMIANINSMALVLIIDRLFSCSLINLLCTSSSFGFPSDQFAIKAPQIFLNLGAYFYIKIYFG